MISIKSIKTFLIINSLLISISILQYKIINYSIFINYIFSLIKVFSLIKIINYNIKDKESLYNQNEIVEKYNNEFNLHIIKTVSIEFILIKIIYYYYFNVN